jgi:ACS family tartrate transporter-like MFS transporter
MFVVAAFMVMAGIVVLVVGRQQEREDAGVPSAVHEEHR